MSIHHTWKSRSSSCRVALGGCPPRAPTDPYVRIERIRLVSAWIRYWTIHGVHHNRRRQRIPLHERHEAVPRHRLAARTAR